MTDVALYQFAMSHYNEKARWGLDWKGIPHVRHSLLPGPHKLQMMRLSGQGQVPVLKDGSKIVHGSSAILAHLETLQAEPRLVPEDPALAQAALRIQGEFDAEVGPAVRLGRFFEVMPSSCYLASQFTPRIDDTARPDIDTTEAHRVYLTLLRAETHARLPDEACP